MCSCCERMSWIASRDQLLQGYTACQCWNIISVLLVCGEGRFKYAVRISKIIFIRILSSALSFIKFVLIPCNNYDEFKRKKTINV